MPKAPRRQESTLPDGFKPIEVPEEFFEEGYRDAVRHARKQTDPIKVAVLFLVRDGVPPSPITWEPEFEDFCGFDEMMDQLENHKIYLQPGERLEVRVIEAKP